MLIFYMNGMWGFFFPFSWSHMIYMPLTWICTCNFMQKCKNVKRDFSVRVSMFGLTDTLCFDYSCFSDLLFVLMNLIFIDCSCLFWVLFISNFPACIDCSCLLLLFLYVLTITVCVDFLYLLTITFILIVSVCLTVPVRLMVPVCFDHSCWFFFYCFGWSFLFWLLLFISTVYVFRLFWFIFSVPFCIDCSCLLWLSLFILTVPLCTNCSCPLWLFLFAQTIPVCDDCLCLFWLFLFVLIVDVSTVPSCLYYLFLFVFIVPVLTVKHLAKTGAFPQKYNTVLKKHCCTP